VERAVEAKGGTILKEEIVCHKGVEGVQKRKRGGGRKWGEWKKKKRIPKTISLESQRPYTKKKVEKKSTLFHKEGQKKKKGGYMRIYEKRGGGEKVGRLLRGGAP